MQTNKPNCSRRKTKFKANGQDTADEGRVDENEEETGTSTDFAVHAGMLKTSQVTAVFATLGDEPVLVVCLVVALDLDGWSLFSSFRPCRGGVI